MRISVTTLQKMAAEGNKIAMLTCYDASFATLLENVGVETLLIGDSLGMVLQGNDSTLPVTLDEMVYHTRCVAKGSKQALIIADMPFGSYQKNPGKAFENAARLMAAGAQMVKLEGGAVMAETINFLVQRGIPVCGHLGLTPQSVHQFGGYRVQGKTDDQQRRLLDDAKLLEQAGAGLVVLEAIPAGLAKQVTETVKSMPTIGIGVKDFMLGATSIEDAVMRFVKDVKEQRFPGPEHSF
jgi:3-methyl-2-oxobutanoate hydroxymethyltransferase